jgi:hypothetical protein
MTDKETVVVEKGERRSNNGWVGVLIALILIVLFFMFGGFSMFSGQASPSTSAPKTTTPTPNTGQ